LIQVQFLGVEIGHAMTRVLALDVETAGVTASASAPHEWLSGLPEGCREQDPAGWLKAVDHAVREVLAELGDQRSAVAGISVTAAAGGVVALDEDDQVVRPVKWGDDVSAEAEAREIARAFGGAPGLIELTGNLLDARSMAAQVRWLKLHEPKHFERTRRLLSVQDFVGYWLSGELGTSASTAATTGWFEVPERAWSRTLVEFVAPEAAAMLSPGLSPGQPRGMLRKPLAEAWGLGDAVWVGPGAGHQAASLFAAGLALPEEMIADLSGEGCLAALSEGTRVDFRGEGEVGCDLAGNGFTRMPMRNVVAAPEMVRRHNGWSAADFEKALAQTPAGADGLLFLPYLRGESVPRLPEASGLLHGITMNNLTPGNLARAAAEGVALGFAYGMSRLQDVGFEPLEIRLTRHPGAAGGQLLADAMGVPVVAVSGGGGALLGAAMQAAAVWFREQGEALGFEEIAGYVVRVDEDSRCTPDPARHAFYQELMGRQQYLAETLHDGGFM
jgi:xylulokinase